MSGSVVRVAALADLHCTKSSQGAFQALFSRLSESAEVVVIGGDLTDYGLPEEARVLAKEIAALRIPAAAVLGNHDGESGKAGEGRQIPTDAGLVVLDGHAHRGQLEGRTASGTPVYNVSMALLTRTFADRPPFRVFEVPVADRAAEQPAAGGPTPMRGRRATDAVAS